MFAIVTAGGMVILPEYQQYWASREGAEAWCDIQGIDKENVKICPVIFADSD